MGLLRVETLSSSTPPSFSRIGTDGLAAPESLNSTAGCGLLGRLTSLLEWARDSLNDGMPSSRLLRLRSGTGVEIDDSLFARLLRLGAAIGILERVSVLHREYLVDISVVLVFCTYLVFPMGTFSRVLMMVGLTSDGRSVLFLGDVELKR